MERNSTSDNTQTIIRELNEIEREHERKQYIIDDLRENNESQKTQITIMRHRNEANESTLDRTILVMLGSMLINFITIGWIVFSAL